MADLDIRIVKKTDLTLTYKEFLKKLDEWLIQFSDPIEEIEDAVEDAFKNGFVICAYRGNTLVGIVIISTSRYETFFPKYHLSYVATKKDIKGMGIATQLFQKGHDPAGHRGLQKLGRSGVRRDSIHMGCRHGVIFQLRRGLIHRSARYCGRVRR